MAKLPVKTVEEIQVWRRSVDQILAQHAQAGNGGAFIRLAFDQIRCAGMEIAEQLAALNEKGNEIRLLEPGA